MTSSFSDNQLCYQAYLWAIDSAKADMTILILPASSICYRNNPKYANRIIKQLGVYAKAQGFDKSYDPYKSCLWFHILHASTNPEIKQLYINGHFASNL